MKSFYSIALVPFVMLLCVSIISLVAATPADAKKEEDASSKDPVVELEKLLHDLQVQEVDAKDAAEHHNENEDYKEEHQAPSSDNEASNESQEDETLSDVFDEKRWLPVYAAPPSGEETHAATSGPTPEQHKAYVDRHNLYRRQEGASNMEILRYNSKLAQLAQTWAQRCVFAHGNPPFSKSDIGFSGLGQNIYVTTSGSFKVEDGVESWYREKKDYNYDTLKCTAGKQCGHYTAVTWAKTTDVGCGVAFCSSVAGFSRAYLFVCNYGPAGNFIGEKNYKKGPACTKCDSGKFFCNNNLCDGSCKAENATCQCKAACQQCGTKTSKCGCACKPGSSGSDCSEACVDKDPKCGANPGWPSFLCTDPDSKWAFVKSTCPKMCKTCQSGNPCGKS
jgi:uncharacterized protein YkwD